MPYVQKYTCDNIKKSCLRKECISLFFPLPWDGTPFDMPNLAESCKMGVVRILYFCFGPYCASSCRNDKTYKARHLFVIIHTECLCEINLGTLQYKYIIMYWPIYCQHFSFFNDLKKNYVLFITRYAPYFNYVQLLKFISRKYINSSDMPLTFHDDIMTFNTTSSTMHIMSEQTK